MEQSGDSCEVSTALKSIDLNSTKENALISTEEKTGCFLCQNPDPIKKCSKSHSRCKGNFFCDKNCELSYHKSEKTKVLDQTFCIFCAGPNFLSQPKTLAAFSASSKTFVLAQKSIFLNANHLFVWHKMFVTVTICK